MCGTLTHTQETPKTSFVNQDYVRKAAKTYGKTSEKRLTVYQEAINEASIELCLQNSNLLSNRKLLLDSARKVINDRGYHYKKGKSRSLVLNPSSGQETTLKRRKISRDVRLSTIANLQEQIKDLTELIEYKEKRRDSAKTVHNYKECEKLTEQMFETKAQRRKLEIELKLLNKKEGKSRLYKTKRSTSTNRELMSPPTMSPRNPFERRASYSSISPSPRHSSISPSPQPPSESEHHTIILSSDESHQAEKSLVQPSAVYGLDRGSDICSSSHDITVAENELSSSSVYF